MLNALVQIITSIVNRIGLGGVFLLMGAESANIPIPSEAIMPFAGFLVARGELNFWSVVVVGTLGNWIGSSLSYWLGAVGGRKVVLRWGKHVRLNEKHLDQAEKWFTQYGQSSVFFGRLLPVVRTFISLPAGFARMPFVTFSLYTILGALPFSLGLTWLGFKLGEHWEDLRRYFHYADVIIVLSLVAIALYLIVRSRSRKNSD